MKLFVTLCVALLVSACSRDKSVAGSHESVNGSLVIAVNSPESPQKSRATKPTKLRIQIINPTGSIIVDSTISLATLVSLVAFDKLDQGANYTGTVWTIDDFGDTIHKPVTKSFAITSSSQTTVMFDLVPICGTIQAVLVDLPTTVDSVHLAFAADSGSFYTAEKRSTKISLELDKVPYGAHGKISLYLTDSNKDTIAHWDTTCTFTNQNINGRISFQKSGSLAVEITMSDPGSTLLTGNGDPTKTIQTESGKIIVTEFCATSGSGSSSAEFIELYNPSTEPFTTTALSLTAGDKTFTVPNVTINPNSYYVISSTNGTAWSPNATVDMDLVGTSGYIAVASENTVHDYVIYFNEQNAGWTTISSSGKKSWELHSLAYSAANNNFGGNWKPASASFKDGSNITWYGTPGK